jgi:hypothetical protein
MNQAWVVVEERGDYSDYRMELISVHDCKESADETRATLENKIEEQEETARSILRKAWELSGRKVPKDNKIWAVNMDCPAEFSEAVNELYNAAVQASPCDAPEYSVQGPFEVIPWVKPGKLIQD